MNKKSKRPDPNTIIDTPHSEQSNRNELQSNNNRNDTRPNHTEQIQTQEDMNMEKN